MTLRAAIAVATISLSCHCSSATAQAPSFSQTDAIRLASQQQTTCLIIPVGVYKLGTETVNLTNLLKRFEATGFVTMTPVNTQTGNVWNDILAVGRNGLSATVNVTLAPNLTISQLCSVTADQKVYPGIPFGPTTLNRVASFQQIHGTGPDGIPFDGYIMQAVWNHEPSALELRFDPTAQRQVKSQALFRHDPFKQLWGIRTYQVKNMDIPFDSAIFAREIGRQ